MKQGDVVRVADFLSGIRRVFNDMPFEEYVPRSANAAGLLIEHFGWDLGREITILVAETIEDLTESSDAKSTRIGEQWRILAELPSPSPEIYRTCRFFDVLLKEVNGDTKRYQSTLFLVNMLLEINSRMWKVVEPPSPALRPPSQNGRTRSLNAQYDRDATIDITSDAARGVLKALGLGNLDLAFVARANP